MFERSRGTIKESTRHRVLWEVDIDGVSWQVLRVNQFESKHMSMSVLVRNSESEDIFVFVKGSPELIQKASINDCHAVPLLVKELSLEGFRVIGVGYKSVDPSELDHFLKTPRENYLLGIRMLGRSVLSTS
jgi:magnesium-transporting ATPase (P-type)